MKAPRGLSAEEQAAWARLAQSVTPLAGRARPAALAKPAPRPVPATPAPPTPAMVRPSPKNPPPARRPAPTAPPLPPQPMQTSPVLDGHWERRFKAGRIEPDLTLDLHGHTLDAAYARITAGLDQARSMGARVVLVIAGRERPVDPADRAERRGAIRAKLLDWLAASRHADAIAAVRRAHRSHGGEGALYLVLKRAR